MKKSLKKAVVILVVLICSTVLSACSSKPFTTIEKFTASFNELNYNKLIECYDPRIIETISGLVSGLASSLGAPGSDGDSSMVMASLMGDLLSEYYKKYLNEEGVTFNVSVKEISTEMNGSDKAKVTSEFTLESSLGDNETWQETQSMVKIDGKWYITISLDDILGLGSMFGSD
jgi:hypothetical protein